MYGRGNGKVSRPYSRPTGSFFDEGQRSRPYGSSYYPAPKANSREFDVIVPAQVSSESRSKLGTFVFGHKDAGIEDPRPVPKTPAKAAMPQQCQSSSDGKSTQDGGRSSPSELISWQLTPSATNLLDPSHFGTQSYIRALPSLESTTRTDNADQTANVQSRPKEATPTTLYDTPQLSHNKGSSGGTKVLNRSHSYERPMERVKRQRTVSNDDARSSKLSGMVNRIHYDIFDDSCDSSTHRDSSTRLRIKDQPKNKPPPNDSDSMEDKPALGDCQNRLTSDELDPSSQLEKEMNDAFWDEDIIPEMDFSEGEKGKNVQSSAASNTNVVENAMSQVSVQQDLDCRDSGEMVQTAPHSDEIDPDFEINELDIAALDELEQVNHPTELPSPRVELKYIEEASPGNVENKAVGNSDEDVELDQLFLNLEVPSPQAQTNFDSFDSLDLGFDLDPCGQSGEGMFDGTEAILDYSEFKEDKRCRRFHVVEIKNEVHTRAIRLIDLQTNGVLWVDMRDDWIDLPLEIGDVINVIGKFVAGRCVVDNNNSNIIILHPDTLVASTVLADSFECMRRAVLQDRIKATSEVTRPLVYGSILHELFQECLVAKNFETVFIHEVIDNLLKTHLEQLYILEESVSVATEYLQKKAFNFQDWGDRFIHFEPQPQGILQVHKESTERFGCVNKILDIEEHIWSPIFGMKGNIDATVQVQIWDPTAMKQKTLVVPLELKTGRNSSVVSHRAQTILYTLLMTDRYDVNISLALLYYMEKGDMILVNALKNELRDLMLGRNRLAQYLQDRSSALPGLLRKEHACKRCYAAVSCQMYHKTLECGTAESSGMGKWFDEQTSHISEQDAEFLQHWESLITKEESVTIRVRQELWSMTSTEREIVGRCFSGMVIIGENETGGIKSQSDQISGKEKIGRFQYLFRKRDSTVQSSAFTDSQLIVGEPIVVSDEKGHFALANGYVTDVKPTYITVSVDRALRESRERQNDFDSQRNQVFTGIVAITSENTRKSPPPNSKSEKTYRIDKDEFSNGMALVRNNLIQFLAKDGNARHRRLIINLDAPVFFPQSEPFAGNLGALNLDQREAVRKVMETQDYACLLGMPGTGKTTTVAQVVLELISQGKSVLVASYTHTAVDSILLKLKDAAIPMLRLGSQSKMHSDVIPFATPSQLPTTLEQLDALYKKPQVVATTCLGINHPIFSIRRFDFCIVDEASQITLPVCLGPIRFADKFVLIGDHNQLSPLVRNPEAQAGGLDLSLFKLLVDAHPQSVVSLTHQYRMCEDIMLLSNTLIYRGRLKCGTQEVAEKRLHIPSPSMILKGSTKGRQWIADILSPNRRVVFANTDAVPAPEVLCGDRIQNDVEKDVLCQIVEAITEAGVPESALGIITVYRSQLNIIKHALKHLPGVEKHTADKFQGRDKECIIISLVRSNAKQQVGSLLKDWRRINVAFTRAKSKLIVLGSLNTLRGTPLLQDFLELAKAHNWVYNLPFGAHVPALPSPLPAISLHRERHTTTKVIKADKESILLKRPILRDIVNNSNAS